VGFAWLVLAAFLRVSTDPRSFPAPLAVDDALDLVEAWLARSVALIVQPSSRHMSVLAGLLRSAGTAANLVNDAHVAALAIEHRASIVSFDRDFRRFQGIKLTAPG
jgi:toxin-antitoxin system PIN domain toxin